MTTVVTGATGNTGRHVVAELLRRGERVYEVPISYWARGRREGKKIRAADGFRGMGVLLRVRLLGR